MKNYILLLMISLLFFQCQGNEKRVNKLGDIRIKQKQFINKIESSCSSDINSDCVLKIIDYDYDKDIVDKNFFRKEERFVVKLEKREVRQSDFGAIDKQTILKTYVDNTVVDSLIVYSVLNKEHAVSKKMYYLDFDLKLWILDFFIDDEGTYVNYWKRYDVDSITGRINLEEDLIKERYPKENQYAKIEYSPEEILKSYSFDINKDKSEDKIIILKSIEEQGNEKTSDSQNFRTLVIYLQKDNNMYHKIAHTIHTIPLKEDGNWVDEAFNMVDKTDKGFVVKTVFADKTNEGWLNGSLEFYFKFEKGFLFLEKVRKEERINEETKLTVKTKKDFGIIKIEDFNYKNF